MESGFLIAFGNYFNKSSLAKFDVNKVNSDIMFCAVALKGSIKDFNQLTDAIDLVLENFDDEHVKPLNEVSEWNWLENPDRKSYLKYILKELLNELYYLRS